MTTIAADPRHLGARIGITAVLHTWGSAMTHHPHVHMIVPGGGIARDGSRWIASRPAFLLPVRVLGKLFRRLFLARLIALHDAGRIGFFGAHAQLADRRAFLRHLAPVRKKRWVVYAKAPFAGPEAVLAYLSRYTHRVAISNSRLLHFDEAGVTFRYKDYRRAGPERQQVMTLGADEFIRRFLLHVLPKGFHRIRHYGLLAGATRKVVLDHARQLLGMTTSRPSRTMSDRHAHAAAGAWSSSRRSNASVSPARRRCLRPNPGCMRHDPARLGRDSLGSACARGAGMACAHRHQRRRRPHPSPAINTGKPAISAPIRTFRIEGRPRTCRLAKLRRSLKPENPIAHRLWPADSGLHDFRTPAGIRNSSGNRPSAYG